MELSFIVNGTETIVKAKKSDKMIVLAKKALEQTENAIRPKKPLDDWALMHSGPGEQSTTLGWNFRLDEQWRRNDEMKKVPLNIKDGDVIFMSLKAGTGA